MNQIDSKKWLNRILVMVYFAVAILAGYHTFNVFSVSDPWPFALLGAVAVDGVLALTLMMIGRWYGDQQVAGVGGTIVFACLSGLMQVIARKLALNEPMPFWLQWVADYAVPISVTLSMITLGVIKYFDRDRNGVPDFLQTPPTEQVALGVSNSGQARIESPENTLWPTPPTPASLAVGGGAETPQKRGPGRPPKSFNASSEPLPKVVTNLKKS